MALEKMAGVFFVQVQDMMIMVLCAFSVMAQEKMIVLHVMAEDIKTVMCVEDMVK